MNKKWYSHANGSAAARLAAARKLVSASPAHTYAQVGVVGVAKQLGEYPVEHQMLTYEWWAYRVSNGFKPLHYANGKFVAV